MNDEGPHYTPMHLSWEGHEFLEAARNETTWNKAKGAVGTAGGMAFDVLKAVLVSYTVTKAKEFLEGTRP